MDGQMEAMGIGVTIATREEKAHTLTRPLLLNQLLVAFLDPVTHIHLTTVSYILNLQIATVGYILAVRC